MYAHVVTKHSIDNIATCRLKHKNTYPVAYILLNTFADFSSRSEADLVTGFSDIRYLVFIADV